MFKPRKKSKKQMVNTAIILIIAVFTILYLLPIYWMGITSFRPEAKSTSWPPNFSPTGLVMDNYRVVFEQKSIFWYIRNSLIASITSVIISLIIGCVTAFSFAFMRWKAKTKTSLLIWIISLRIMPPIAAAIPLFLIFARLRMIDTFPALILAYTFFNLSFVIWLVYGFFKELPREIVEAGLIDGCSYTKLFTRVVIPLTIPGIMTVTLLTFIASWNEFLFAVKLTAFNTRTIPVLISGFMIDRGLLWGQVSAVGLVSIIPVIIVALFIQRYIVSGLTFGAIK